MQFDDDSSSDQGNLLEAFTSTKKHTANQQLQPSQDDHQKAQSTKQQQKQ
jgi:hypothetical protein